MNKKQNTIQSLYSSLFLRKNLPKEDFMIEKIDVCRANSNIGNKFILDLSIAKMNSYLLDSVIIKHGETVYNITPEENNYVVTSYIKKTNRFIKIIFDSKEEAIDYLNKYKDNI